MNLPQGLLGTAGLMGLCVGLLLASVPAALAFAAFRRLQEGLRRRHAELAATYRRNQSIVEGSGEGVLELDRAGYVRYANPAAVKLLAYEAHELIGLDYRVLLNTQEDGRTDAIRQIGYTTNILGGVGALLRRKSGQHRPVEYKTVSVSEEGASVGTVLVFRDISERVRVDNLLTEMQAAARVGGWEYDVETKKIFWTDAMHAIYDLPADQPVEWSACARFFAPADYEKLHAAAVAAIESGLSSDLHVQSVSAERQEDVGAPHHQGGATQRQDHAHPRRPSGCD